MRPRVLSVRDWLALGVPYRRGFVVLLGLNMLAFGPFLIQPIMAPDAISGLSPFALVWQREFPTDRPLADLVLPFLSSGAAAPLLQLSIVVAANALSAVLLCAHLRVRRTLEIILVGALITTCPAWADQLTFLNNTVRFIPLAFPLAILGYLLALQPSTRSRGLAFVILVVIAGLYQLALNTYLMLAMIDLIALALFANRVRAWQYIGRHVIPALAVLVLAAVAYVAFGILAIAEGEGRFDEYLTPIGSVDELMDKMDMYARFADSIFGGMFVGLFAYGAVILVGLIVVGSLAALSYLVRRYPAREAAVRTFLAVVLTVALFLAIVATQSFNTSNQVFLRLLVSAGLFFAFFLVLAIYSAPVWEWGRRLALLASGIIVFMFVTTDGYIHSVGYAADRADEAIATRMAALIDAQTTTADPLPLVVIGRSASFLGLGSWVREGALAVAARPWFDAPVSSFRADWSKREVFNVIGHDHLIAGDDDVARACDLSRSMPVWPANGSVLVKDGLSVVKVGEPVEADGCPSDPVDDAASLDDAAPLEVTEDPPAFLAGKTIAVEGAECNMETLNGVRWTDGAVDVELAEAVEITGWAFDGERSALPRATYVRLRGPAGASYYARASRVERPDVGTYFGDPTLAGAGYEANFLLGPAPAGEYGLVVVMETEGQPLLCDAGRRLRLERGATTDGP